MGSVIFLLPSHNPSSNYRSRCASEGSTINFSLIASVNSQIFAQVLPGKITTQNQLVNSYVLNAKYLCSTGGEVERWDKVVFVEVEGCGQVVLAE